MKSAIKASTDISYIFSHGKRFGTPYVTVLVLKLESQHDRNGRVAVIAGKKLGCAVWRNQAKRRMRALIQDLGGPWDGYDVIFMARRSVLNNSYDTVKSACEKALKKAKIV